MSEELVIRPATSDDAESACALVRSSIIELCTVDHNGDALTLEGWLANKTPKNMAYWMSAPGMNAFIAERAGAMIGVGAVRDDGEVTLAYVAPSSRFSGVTSALLTQMESVAKEKLAERMSLTTTETARQFYLARGYIAEDEEGDLFNDEQCVLIKEF